MHRKDYLKWNKQNLSKSKSNQKSTKIQLRFQFLQVKIQRENITSSNRDNFTAYTNLEKLK